MKINNEKMKTYEILDISLQKDISRSFWEDERLKLC